MLPVESGAPWDGGEPRPLAIDLFCGLGGWTEGLIAEGFDVIHGSGAVWFDTGPAALSSKSNARKAASALIAKIPLMLARHIAAYWKPR